MKKKVVFNWFVFLIYFIVMGALASILMICTDDISSTGRTIGIIVLCVGLVMYIIMMNEFFMLSVLTEDTVYFKHRITGKKQFFPVGKINRFVVDFDPIDRKNELHMVIYANNKDGQILGVGNAALMALMKYYPHVPVVLKDIHWFMMRSTAKYIVKYQKTSKFKCKKLCEHYHLPKNLLEYTTYTDNIGDEY